MWRACLQVHVRRGQPASARTSAESRRQFLRTRDLLRTAFAQDFIDQFARAFLVTHFLVGTGKFELGIDLVLKIAFQRHPC